MPSCSPWLVLLSTLVLGACASDNLSPLGSVDALGHRLVSTLCPDAMAKVQPVANLHISGQVDQLEARHCELGRATVYKGKSISDPAGLPVEVEVTAVGAGLPDYLEINESIDRAVKRLGAPTRETSNTMIYELTEEGVSELIVNFQADRITAVKWSWGVD